ncbi:MAG: XRE family transcriptional regulator [Proteobacteria bacterium]|nr:XRE family transcriptional regulator [Pseudomonadota bacterium]NDC24505.1 XRE family transcriptional regulator [Pseudomonadota bacterium]NDD05013.1 XRE family transcriptional regulator [Pseudomonadota bacterium]NDG27487.1 XRE family transcriptional regulator [Pseudomonadota bacterium]
MKIWVRPWVYLKQKLLSSAKKKKAIAKLKAARERKGLTQAQVAKLANTKQPAIARMEVGLVSEVSLDFLFKVAWVLNVKLTIHSTKEAA